MIVGGLIVVANIFVSVKWFVGCGGHFVVRFLRPITSLDTIIAKIIEGSFGSMQ